MSDEQRDEHVNEAESAPEEAGASDAEAVTEAEVVTEVEAEVVTEVEVEVAAEVVNEVEAEAPAAGKEDAAADTSAEGSTDGDEPEAAPIVKLSLAADARYRATGKRKTAVARVILKPGTGEYLINGKSLAEYMPRPTLQVAVRSPLIQVGYDTKMDVIARIHGGGVSAQAGALRHGISRALVDAEPSLRIELKRSGFLTRDSRVKERKKAGLKKARKRPQFSKR